jgi:hypothetical protein
LLSDLKIQPHILPLQGRLARPRVLLFSGKVALISLAFSIIYEPLGLTQKVILKIYSYYNIMTRSIAKFTVFKVKIFFINTLNRNSGKKKKAFNLALR